MATVDSQEWDQRYAGAELVWTAEPNRFVVAELQDLPPGRALDVAAGEGRNAVWLAARGWQVTAVDFSAVGLDKGRQLAQARGVTVDWVQANVLDYQPEAAAFQLVLVAYLQLREAELDGVLRRAATALAPGGVLLVVGHDVANLTEGIGGPPDPAVLYTPESVTRSLSGLTVLRAERVRRPVAAAGGDREAVDTLVRAART
ncbi:MAG TPA: class I SAM-dependent methyltransferase [Streptosporangiaceae bacterium]|nr:class I SAM-dependent methyltransferase [Streptosporangiaceae bacterium]